MYTKIVIWFHEWEQTAYTVQTFYKALMCTEQNFLSSKTVQLVFIRAKSKLSFHLLSGRLNLYIVNAWSTYCKELRYLTQSLSLEKKSSWFVFHGNELGSLKISSLPGIDWSMKENLSVFPSPVSFTSRTPRRDVNVCPWKKNIYLTKSRSPAVCPGYLSSCRRSCVPLHL